MYIGLTDLKKSQNSFSQAEFTELIKAYCTEHKIDYSISTINGGFNHSTGYIIEDSIVITLFGYDSSRFPNSIKDIKELINTDTILVTREYVDVTFI